MYIQKESNTSRFVRKNLVSSYGLKSFNGSELNVLGGRKKAALAATEQLEKRFFYIRAPAGINAKNVTSEYKSMSSSSYP